MHLRILYLRSYLSTHHIHLLLRILQQPREERIGESLEAFVDLQVIPRTDFFLFWAQISETVYFATTSFPINKERHCTYQMFVRRPCAHGPNKPFGFHVREPDVFHPTFELRSGTGFHIGGSGGFDELMVEFQRGVFRFERIIWRRPIKIEVDAFDPAAGFDVPDG